MTLIGGGAAGALINAFVSWRRNRSQPVGYRIEKKPLFQNLAANESLLFRVTALHQGMQFPVDNLYTVQVDIINRGNQDRPTFAFGITLPEGHQAIALESTGRDRHHLFEKQPDISPAAPIPELDFVVKPFNRGDEYSLRFYVTSSDIETDTESPILISSSEPVSFIELASEGATATIAISFGGLRVLLGRDQ